MSHLLMLIDRFLSSYREPVVPCPNEDCCERAYQQLRRRLQRP